MLKSPAASGGDTRELPSPLTLSPSPQRVQLHSPLAVSVPLTAVKPSAPTGLDFAAGCLAGTVSVLVCHPIDTIRIQVQNGQFSKISECYQSYLRNGGRLGLFKGLFPPLMGASLQNAGVFGMKAVTQVFLKDTNDKSGQDSVFTSDKMISSAAAGLAGGVIASPIELLKIRQQLSQRGCDSAKLWPLTRGIVTNSGCLSIFRGLSATLVREVPASIVWFTTYDYSKKELQGVLPKDSVVSDVAAVLTAASLAGMSSWAITYPIDVVKTKIQAEPSLKWKDRVSCAQMFRRLLKESGRSVFIRTL